MRTIGRRWPVDAPRGDYQAPCSYCGVVWRRSQLTKDESGNYACPDEGAGRDAAALAKGNARAAKAFAHRRPPAFRGGPFTDGLVRVTEASTTVTYDDPLTRFGTRLVGWYTCTAEHVTVDNGQVSVVADRSSWGNDISSNNPTLTLLVDDETLERKVLQAGDTLTASGLSGISRPVPMSLWVTARLTPQAVSSLVASSGSFAISSLTATSGFKVELLSSLRITSTGVRARWRLFTDFSVTAEKISGVVEAEPTSDWCVYGLVWTDDGRISLIVNDTVCADAEAPSVTLAMTALNLADTPSTGTFIADAAVVSGTISEDEALAQSRYMMQSAGIE